MIKRYCKLKTIVNKFRFISVWIQDIDLSLYLWFVQLLKYGFYPICQSEDYCTSTHHRFAYSHLVPEADSLSSDAFSIIVQLTICHSSLRSACSAKLGWSQLDELSLECAPILTVFRSTYYYVWLQMENQYFKFLAYVPNIWKTHFQHSQFFVGDFCFGVSKTKYIGSFHSSNGRLLTPFINWSCFLRRFKSSNVKIHIFTLLVVRNV